MKLHGMQLLMLVSDGVHYDEVCRLRNGFEREYAEVFVTSPHAFLSIETVCQNRRGSDLVIDFPLEAASTMHFNGLIIPDGTLSSDLLAREVSVHRLVRAFHEACLPIFASGEAVAVLRESGILAENILLRDLAPIDLFIEQAIALLIDGTVPNMRLRTLQALSPASG